MKTLNPIELLRPYEVLKQCHYQTKHGFRHEQYDALIKVVRKYGDSFIETYMYHEGKAGLVPRDVPSMFLYGQDDEQVWKIADESISVMYNTMAKIAKGKIDLEKLVQDFIQEAHQILALIKEYE